MNSSSPAPPHKKEKKLPDIAGRDMMLLKCKMQLVNATGQIGGKRVAEMNTALKMILELL